MPAFRKFGGYTAYQEGWGLYAERLGKDVGFYQDPYSDYGRLEADNWRAIRLVVDTGVHSQHWTRQQMVDYFHDHSNIDETQHPGGSGPLYCVAGTGTGLQDRRTEDSGAARAGEKALGDKFDLRAFHDEVLDAGALPLDVLSERIDAWIASQKGAGQ